MVEQTRVRRYQYGSLRLKKRKNGPAAWEFRYYDLAKDGQRVRKYLTVGSKTEYPTRASALKAVEGFLLKLNAESPEQDDAVTPTFGAVIERYKRDEMPERYSTAKSYHSMLKNHILPKWGDCPIDAVKPTSVREWLNALELAPKTKAHIRGLMHTIFNCAEMWEYIDLGKNPVRRGLVRVKGATKRLKRPRILTVEEFWKLVVKLKEPYRTMVIVAGSLGLRVSEIAALQWGDFNFDKRVVLVQRACVDGRVDDVKTECSGDELPLDTELIAVLLQWKKLCSYTGAGDWVFRSPKTGKPFHACSIQQDHIRPAAEGLGLVDVGWHTMRHSYRSWLDATGAPIGVQQKLMRHAQVSTTMNVYGNALMESKRDANSSVVEMLFRSPGAEKAPLAQTAQ